MKHHSQTRIASLVESLVSNAIGFFLTVAAQWVIFEKQSLSENLFFSSVLLILHIIRSYLVRRGFNAYVLRKARLAKKKKKELRAVERKIKNKAKKHHGQENSKTIYRDDTASGV